MRVSRLLVAAVLTAVAISGCSRSGPDAAAPDGRTAAPATETAVGTTRPAPQPTQPTSRPTRPPTSQPTGELTGELTSQQPGAPAAGEPSTRGANQLAGIEVIPETAGSTASGLTLPLPPPPAVAELVSLPLPAASSARGRLTAGYPRDVLPPVPGSRVLSSSVSPSGRALQVGLTGRSTFGVQAQLRYYRKKLSRLGFSERPVDAVGGATAAAFERGRDTVVVTVSAGATTFDVYAVLRVGEG